MSVARKTPKFADCSHDSKWDKASKKKNDGRRSELGYLDKENYDALSNIPNPFSERNWDDVENYHHEIDSNSDARSSKRNSKDSKNDFKKKPKEVKQQYDIREMDEEDDDHYTFIKKQSTKNKTRSTKETEEEYNDFQEIKKNPFRKSARPSARLGGESLDLTEITNNYLNQDKDSCFERHIEKLKNLGREDEELEVSELASSSRYKESKENRRPRNYGDDSPSSSKYTESLKKELKTNLERVRSFKKERGSIDGLSELSEGSVLSLSKRLGTGRQTPTSKRFDQQPEPITKLKKSNSKSKFEVQGKIDFINSIFEELNLNGKEEPKPSAKSKHPKQLPDVENERVIKEISERIPSTRKDKTLKKKDLEPDLEHDDEEEVYQSKKASTKTQAPAKKGTTKSKPKEIEDNEDDIENYPIQPKSRKNSKKLEEPLEEHLLPKKAISRKSSLSKLPEPDVPKEDSENQFNTNQSRQSQRAKPTGHNSARKESSKPPLPVKREEEEEQGYEEPIPSVSDKHPLATLTSEKRSTPKNFVEMNKGVVDATKKLHKSYEKVLINFDQNIKPMLNNMQKKTQQSPSRGTLPSPGRTLKSPGSAQRQSKRTLTSSSPIRENFHYEAACQGFINSAQSMQQFYQEITNLTQKITDAAAVMQQTLEQIESFRRTEESRYSVRTSGRKLSYRKGHDYENEYSSKRNYNYRRDEEDEEEDQEEQDEEEQASDSSDS